MPPAPTTAHRLLTGIIATGAVLIAGIGFTGSYTAVRNLAMHKGFGTFATLYPLGIDAGICVLLALDLHLTHLRIPLPLLRHTAWLLTAATITFNAATAWPDPLGTSMHAVIPLLFIVTIEAARHATSRLTHLTAGTHMDSIRPARWLLAPARTLLLWRRMKLWEIRSYQQAIALEQQQLIYRTQLRNRYGRAWRHTAPVEALLPLRLTRYGIPLPHTAPATNPDAALAHPPPATQHVPGPADTPDGPLHADTSRSIKPPLPRTRSDSAPSPVHTGRRHTTPDASPHPEQLRAFYAALTKRTGNTTTPTRWARQQHDHSHTPAPDNQPQQTAGAIPNKPTPHAAPSDTSQTAHPAQLDTHQQAHHHPNGVPTHHLESVPLDAAAPAEPGNSARPEPGGQPLTDPSSESHAATESHRQPLPRRSWTTSQTSPSSQRAADSHRTRASTPPSRQPAGGPSPTAPQKRPAPHPDTPRRDFLRQPGTTSRLTRPDRYYLQWMTYQATHGTEPTPEQLSTRLAHQGLLGRGGNPISPSNIRRHLLKWRIYNLWTQHHTDNTPPTPSYLAQLCATHGITSQYNRPITPQYITRQTPEFQRRRHTLLQHQTPDHHPNPQPDERHNP